MVIQTINYLNEWKCLPWEKISNRVSTLQKSIYQATKECNIVKLSQLKYYMMNSNDTKLLAVQTVLGSIHKYYLNLNREKYHFNDQDKFIIYKALHSRSVLDRHVSNIVEQIKQYILYMCVQPEWSARFKNISTKYYTKTLNKEKNLDLIYNSCILTPR